MLNLLFQIAGYRDLKSFLDDYKRGLRPSTLTEINNSIKNCKVKVSHLGHWRKCRSLGPSSSSSDSAFLFENKRVTVAQYFELMARDRQKGKLYQSIVIAFLLYIYTQARHMQKP